MKKDDKIDTYYTGATIFFPEWIEETLNFMRDDEFLKQFETPKLRENIISYKENDFLVEANIYPHNVPKQIAEMPEIQTKIVEPTLKVIKEDITSIDELLGEFRKLAKAKKIGTKMTYMRSVTGNSFDVYDFSHRNIFEQLHQMTKIPKEMLNKDYESFYNLAECITPGNKHQTVAYVNGSTLKGATERALKLYNSEEAIGKIDELFHKKR